MEEVLFYTLTYKYEELAILKIDDFKIFEKILAFFRSVQG